MEDLASYLGGMAPDQRQVLLAEQMRAQQQGDYQQRLGAAMRGDPRMRMIAMAAMLSGNKAAADASGFAYKSDMDSNAPKQLGSTGFFNPRSGEFVENPMYTDEKRSARDARRWERELARETALDTARTRADSAEAQRAMQLQIAQMYEQGRRERAADANALRQTIAAMSAGRQRDALYDRVDKQDEAALAEARKTAGKADAAAMAERGDKQLSSKEMTDLQDLHNQVRKLADLTARAGEGGIGPRGPMGGLGMLEEAKALAARQSPAVRDALGPAQQRADEWWADYRAQFENLERNKLFGSALTAAEAAVWNKSNITRGMSDGEIQRVVALKMGIANQALARLTQGQAANRKDVDALQATTEGFYTAPPKPEPTDPTGLLPPERAARLRQRGVIPEPSPTGSVAPTRTAPPPPQNGGQQRPAPVVTPDGWKIEVEQ